MPVKLNVLITGASGFIGQALAAELKNKEGYRIVTASRKSTGSQEGIEHRKHDLLDLAVIPALEDIDVVVHTAARVHVMDDLALDKLAAYREANVIGTVALANAAANGGVKRFIFLSSIKVNGEETAPGRAFNAFDIPDPKDEYGISKLEAEVALRDIEKRTGMQVVVIRPPLVYGPGVKANFREMMKWLTKGIPLPLGAINNQRSLLAIANLIDLLVVCCVHPNAGGETFLASDGRDISTSELLRNMGRLLGRQCILVPVPASLLTLTCVMIGKSAIANRLCNSLRLDIDHTCIRLNWCPPVSLEEGLSIAATAFKAEL